MSKQNNIDWQGLFNWSTQYHDGTAPSNFAPMGDDDKEWLAKALEQYTFDDADRLKEIVKEMQEDQAKEFGEGSKTGQALHDQLEEL